MTTRYAALRRYITETPWALHIDALLQMQAIIARRLEGDRLTAEELAEIRAAAPVRTAPPAPGGGIAVLPLWGMLTPHRVSDISSGPTTAVDAWLEQFCELVDDASIGTIVLDVDSPGGSADLITEAAAVIRDANARKEIIAVANTRAASAAYWLASQAGTFYVSPSGAVGSIGVYAAHEDISRALEKDGVTVTLVSAGARKVDGNPFEPLSDEARATIQANVNSYYEAFLGDVAAGRGVDIKRVMATFGEGAMILAADAKNRGMVDGVASLNDVLAVLLEGQPATTRRRTAALELAGTAGAIAAATSSSGTLGGFKAAHPRRPLGDLVLAAAAELRALEIEPEPDDEPDDDPDDELETELETETPAATAPAPPPAAPTTNGRSSTMGPKSMQELEERRSEIDARILELTTTADGRGFEPAESEEYEALKAEATAIAESMTAITAELDDRRATLATIAGRGNGNGIKAVEIRKPLKGGIGSNVDANVPDNLHDLDAYKGFASSIEELYVVQAEGAKRIAEQVRFIHPDVEQEAAHDRLETILGGGDEKGQLARRVIICGDPAYDRAFGKAVMRGRDSLSIDEDRIMRAAVTEAGLGSETPVPITIDATIALTSSGSTNPIRGLAAIRTITGLTYRGLTSGGVTAQYEAEGDQVPDDSPTFGGSDKNVLRCDAYGQFSVEVDEDWPGLRAELALEFADAKDVVEGSKFVVGSGSGEPQGVITGVTANTASIIKTATTATFAIDDPDLASNDLGPRFDAEAAWLGNKTVWAKIEALYRAAGNSDPFSFAFQGIPNVQGGGPVGRLFRGYPTNAASAMSAAFATSGANIMVLGDFGRGMVIVDRIGMNVELVPLVMGANGRPIGERGIWAYWRNTSFVKVPSAFRVLQVR